MTPSQFRSILDRLGLTQADIARLLRANGRTTRRWALGERAVPAAVEIILGLMASGKVTADDIQRQKAGRQKP